MNARSEDRDFLRYRDEGSTEALARVFDAVAPRLLLVAAHLAPDAAQAEDLVQTAFLHGMRDAARFDGKRPVAGWLAGILNHRALDLRRRSAIRAHEPLHESAAVGLDPSELAADQELLEHIVAKIDQIESPYREALSLRVVHGLKATSIAHTLGRSPGTVRMQLKRGLERLRAAMPERSALLGVFVLDPGRGLDVVKEAVLAKAGAGAVAAATAVTASQGILGGFAIMKLSAIAIAAVLLSVLLINLVGHDEDQGEPVFGAAGTPDTELATRVLGSAPGEPTTLESDVASDLRVPMDPTAEPQPTQVPRGDFAVHVRYEKDGAPATDVGVYVRESAGDSLGYEARTNAQGIVRFENLADEQHNLHVDRLETPIPFDGSRTAPLEVRIPSGVQVTGRVLDLEGNTVPGARIMRFNESHHDVMQLAAIADENGRFALRDVTEGTEFLARVEGFQPSELVTVRASIIENAQLESAIGARGDQVSGRVIDVDDNAALFPWIDIEFNETLLEEVGGSTEGTKLRVREDGLQPSELETVRASGAKTELLEFVMGARGHRVSGQVIDVDGNPAPRAWIAIGIDEDAREELRGSNVQPILDERKKALDLEALLLRADDNGHFDSREVPAGYVLVLARPVDQNSDQVGSETLWIRYGTEEELTIQLRPGAVIEGTARDTDGKPLAGLKIEAEWEGTQALGQMEDDIGPWISDRRCVTAEDGSFRLAGLLAGDYDLRMSGRQDRFLREERLIAEQEFIQWNPVIDPLAELNVRVVGANGNPLAGWVVCLSSPDRDFIDWKYWQTHTDKDGRRRLQDLHRDTRYTLTLYPPDSENRFATIPAATRTDVSPGTEELKIQLTSSETEFGSISGIWSDPTGEPRREQWVRLERVDGTGHRSARTDHNGLFELKTVPAGEYRFATDGAEQELESFSLAPGQDYDMGELRSGEDH